ncbi:MAG: DoxX family protein [Acidimicrobiia bacterium]
MDPLDYVLLALRVWLGIVMLAHGIGHVRNLDGTASWFASVGFRAARAQATASGLGELAIGAGLILGLLTAPAAAGLIATMTIAFWSIHRFAGFFVYARPDEGYEYVATLAVVAAAVAILGPGAMSVDAVLGLDEAITPALGSLIALVGVALGAVQLALTWRRPDPGA